jgi:hypothetical protein
VGSSPLRGRVVHAGPSAELAARPEIAERHLGFAA